MAKQPTSSRKKGGTSPRQILLYAGIGVAVLAVLYAAFGLESEEEVSVEEIAGSPEIEGDALPALNPDGTDTAINSSAPVVEGADFDGNPTTVGDGPAELLVFMASWCPACQAELPELVEYLDEQGLPDGVELTVVVTSLDANRPPWPPSGWLERGGYTGPILVDDADGSIAQAYGMSGTPFFVAVDDGFVVFRHAGQLGMEAVDEVATAIAP